MDIAAKTDAFVAKYNGQKIDEDGYYGTQCWDVPARFAREYLGVSPFPTGSGGAEGVYRLFRDPLPRFFDRIANSPDPNNIPRKGDIVVWTSAVSPPWGHIAVVLSANSNSMQVFEQNGGIDPNGDGIADGKAYIINRGYANVAGWLRFRAGEEINVEFKRQVTRLAYALYLNRGLSIKEYTSRDNAQTPDAIMAEVAGSGEAFNTWKRLAAAFQVNITDDQIRAHQADYNNAFPLMVLFKASDLPNKVQILGQQLTDANTNIAALTGQISELNKRPTQAQLDQLKATADTATESAKKAQAELEKVAAERAAEAEVGNRFLRWLGAQLSKLPGINIGGGN